MSYWQQPAGYRSEKGGFYSLESVAVFWSSTLDNNYKPWVCNLYPKLTPVTITVSVITKGRSVRCVQN